ncbi:MAG: sigma-70 family RNA polymerase sigma factor [Bacteroidota bacterium]
MNGETSLLVDCDTELLYLSYKEPLLGLLESKLADPAVAEDILHDAFEKFDACRRAGKSCQHPKAYLFRIALNALSDYYRKQEKQKRAISPYCINEEFSSMESTHCDLNLCLHGFLQNLAPENKEALIEVYFHDTPQHELAQKLNIPVSTLKSRVQRSKRYLLRAFQNCFLRAEK